MSWRIVLVNFSCKAQTSIENSGEWFIRREDKGLNKVPDIQGLDCWGRNVYCYCQRVISPWSLAPKCANCDISLQKRQEKDWGYRIPVETEYLIWLKSSILWKFCLQWDLHGSHLRKSSRAASVANLASMGKQTNYARLIKIRGKVGRSGAVAMSPPLDFSVHTDIVTKSNIARASGPLKGTDGTF